MRKRNVMVAAILAVGMVVAGQGLASAEETGRESTPVLAGDVGAGPVPGGHASWDEFMRVQERLDAKAEQIADVGGDGFSGIEVSAERRALTVYWKGDAPAGLTEAVEKAQTDGDTVSVVPARYSESELMAEADRLAEEDGVSAVAPKVDGSGLLVSLLPGHLGVVLSPIPVTTDQAEPALASRKDDSSPYTGGARWNGCSSGFAISIKGSKKMLSAGHCADNGDTARDGGGQTMGKVAGDSNTKDRLYINTNSRGRVYNGSVAPNGAPVNEYTNAVVGASRSFVGDVICSSGAYSGTRCGSRVVAVNQTINVGYLIYETVRAEKTDRTAAIGNGDSGGPSFAVASDNTKVIAKGTHTAIDLSTASPCTGVPTGAGGGRQCAWRFYYVDVTRSLDAYGAKIVTG
ncbi:MAG: hypothetical protein AB7J32_06560 [Pseudonocardia sp.]